MSTSIALKLNEKLFLKDPEETEMGRKILSSSIKLIDEIGFEQFTFKKLAQEMHSTEATMYKYFQNKHKLLVYLISWYWGWLDYRIDYETKNLTDPVLKLKIFLKIISEPQQNDPNTYIDEEILHRIVIAEASKAYLTKDVDENNKDGLFREYKNICKKISSLILQICPDHSFSHSLVSTIIETAHQQMFFANHLPSLSDFKKNQSISKQLVSFLEHLAFSSIAGFKTQEFKSKS